MQRRFYICLAIMLGLILSSQCFSAASASSNARSAVPSEISLGATPMPLDIKRRIVRSIVHAFEESNQVDRCRAINFLRKHEPALALNRYSNEAQDAMMRLMRKANPSFPVADYCAYSHLIQRLDDVRFEMQDEWLKGNVTVLPGKIRFNHDKGVAIVSYKKFLRSANGVILRAMINTLEIQQVNDVPLGSLTVIHTDETISVRARAKQDEIAVVVR